LTTGHGLTSVDLLEEIRAALDGLEPLLLGRMVDIEMPRLRVLTDPTLCRRLLGELIGYAVAHSEPPDSVTVRVARTRKAARIEVESEGGHATRHDLPNLTSAAEELLAVGGEIGSEGPVGSVVSWMRLPLAPGASSAADA
jgi:signal transduction histidine kinase